jgi:hypothetical protein
MQVITSFPSDQFRLFIKGEEPGFFSAALGKFNYI